MEERRAVLDSDFLQNFLRTTDKAFFKEVMSELGIKPLLHPYVATVELQFDREVQELLDEGYVQVVSYDEFLGDENERALYNSRVWEIMDDFSEEELPDEKYRDVFVVGFHLSQKSIGEIMSELMAHDMGIPLFASNDKGSKIIASRHFNRQNYCLEVKNVAEIFEMLAAKENSIKWKNVKRVLSDARWEKERKRLKKMWESMPAAEVN
jgi:hypothetical protein